MCTIATAGPCTLGIVGHWRQSATRRFLLHCFYSFSFRTIKTLVTQPQWHWQTRRQSTLRGWNRYVIKVCRVRRNPTLAPNSSLIHHLMMMSDSPDSWWFIIVISKNIRTHLYWGHYHEMKNCVFAPYSVYGVQCDGVWGTITVHGGRISTYHSQWHPFVLIWQIRQHLWPLAAFWPCWISHCAMLTVNFCGASFLLTHVERTEM